MRAIFFIIALLLSCSFALKLSNHNLENHNSIVEVGTIEDFNSIYTSQGPIIAYFYAGSWCGLCTNLTPTIKNLAETYSNIPVVFVNIDDSPDLTEAWQVAGLPTTLSIRKDGSVAGTVVGAKPAFVTRLFANVGK